MTVSIHKILPVFSIFAFVFALWAIPQLMNRARKYDIERLELEIKDIRATIAQPKPQGPPQKLPLFNPNSADTLWKFDFADTLVSYRKGYLMKAVTFYYSNRSIL